MTRDNWTRRSPQQAWPIERRWLVEQGDAQAEMSAGEALLGSEAVVVLGAAGLGKSWELRRLAESERKLGRDVISLSLGQIATSADRLDSRLHELAENAKPETVLYLDALDEANASVKQATQIISQWVREAIRPRALRLRISCRSTVWPESLAVALREAVGKERVAVASLLPLTAKQVEIIAQSEGLDAGRFMEAVGNANAVALTEQPLTLLMLLKVFASDEGVLRTRGDLFRRGVAVLAEDQHERLEAGTANELNPQEVARVAALLACISMLTGREAFDIGGDEGDGVIGLTELQELDFGSRALNYGVVRAVSASGLFESASDYRFRFVHRQVAEYLAGRLISGLPLHQVRSLLASAGFVSGPLRETAAFAAMESNDVAEWLSVVDPEVIGLSDVANDRLRALAVERLVNRFRSSALTRAQLGLDGIELRGFQYDRADVDLRRLLSERGKSSEDVLELAVSFARSWGLTYAMSDDLAHLMLDSSAPFEARKSAGHALAQEGAPDSRSRLRPLIEADHDDRLEELKGLALESLWPDFLSVKELLQVLSKPRSRSYSGSYSWFISTLARGAFDPRQDIVAWLEWSVANLPEQTYEPFFEICRRVAVAAVTELDEPDVRRPFARLVLQAGDDHVSILSMSKSVPWLEVPDDEDAEPPVWQGEVERRGVLSALVEACPDEGTLLLVLFWTPGLLVLEDFGWLLERAIDEHARFECRNLWALIASRLNWQSDPASIAVWDPVQGLEPIATHLEAPGVTSERRRRQQEELAAFEENEADAAASRPIKPTKSVAELLGLCEQRDPGYFHGLCRVLPLGEDGSGSSFERFLVSTRGWQVADRQTRSRIVAAAVRFLEAEDELPKECESMPLSSILVGPMAALFLIHDSKPDWLEQKGAGWWDRWSWLILRELHPVLNSEPKEPKERLFSLLWERASDRVCEHLDSLARETDFQHSQLLLSLLPLVRAQGEQVLDRRLLAAIERGEVAPRNLQEVVEFAFEGAPAEASNLCLRMFRGELEIELSERISAGCALLRCRPLAVWDSLLGALRAELDLASRVLSQYAHAGNLRQGRTPITALGERRIGELLLLMHRVFPPEKDPKHEGVFSPDPLDSVTQLRWQLLNWLVDKGTADSVDSMKVLECALLEEYPWLRLYRSNADRAFRIRHWTPIPSTSVARLIANRERRLVASEEDAAEGVLEAVGRYESRLQAEAPSGVEDLWNTATGQRPSPKHEEHISDKVCTAIREFFDAYAVTADREVQLRRRHVAKAHGGAAGSEADVLVRVSASGSASHAPIVVPIEVKKSHHDEVKTALKSQLADRYMRQSGARCGVYVVAWMDAPGLGAAHRPKWKSLDAAREDLERQAAQLQPSAQDVRSVVFDASLPGE